jgi:hypothetical protein
MTAVVQEGIRWSMMIKSVWDLSFRLFGGGPVPCRRYTRRRRSTRDPGSYSALASRTHIRTTRMSPPSASTVQCVIFLNRRQQLLHRAISSTIEQIGIPKIMELDGRVWIDVPSHAMQCLFACDGAFAPIGVALYERPSTDILSVCHLAVDPAYAFGGINGGGGLGLLLIERVKEIAGRIKGVTRVQIP